ncbi:MAG TPA: hypothetical protein ENI19_02570 [Candidatus Nealsonbacteria bacterium]|uniref:Uncharacterized protein n=1 Tax=marine sediment metagenome TaxID=412755 RepID=A0A0F9XIN6_9ZZZZ|nr:hypothetical protein [Candidatus Nealsonbacteria bacterium]HEB46572.1 hypothetical protein [Candidatus Nealsonbacteria bacterium]
MREQLINIFSKIIEWGLILLVFLLPLFFLPITTEAFEFPKQLLLIFFVSVLTIIWAIKMILERSVKILHSPLTIPILAFFGFFFLSTVFSVHRFASIFGSYPRFNDGLVSLFIYLLVFFLVASNIKENKQIVRILAFISFSGVLVAILGILNFFDFYLLANLLKNPLITPAGFADRTVFFLAILFPIIYWVFLFEKKKIFQVLSALTGFLFLFYIFLISHLAAISAVFLVFLLLPALGRFQLSKVIAIKVGIVFLTFLFLLAINNIGFIKSQIPFLKDRTVQHELKISPNTAWAITTGSFQNLKLLTLGSGPGTYLFDFTSFKPIGFNQTPFWNLRFERSFNEYFQIISTLGILAFFAFLWILFRFFQMAREVRKKITSENKESHTLAFGLFSSLSVFLLISLFTSSFTLIYFTFWLFLGLAVSFSRIAGLGRSAELSRSPGVRDIELSLATIQIRGISERKGEIMPWLAAAFIILVLLPLLWKEAKIVQAELHFARAQIEQLQESPDPDLILGSLVRARNIMPNNDSYRRALSAISLNFTILAEQQKLLSDEARQQLLQTAVIEGEMAVRLAPHNIFNWENLQRVYSLVTLENQDDLLINNVFPQEILLDPANPRHRNDLGWTYFNLRNDIELAKRNFQDAISLKPDFVDAHYSLARVYKEEGKRDLALPQYEQTLNLLNQQIASLEPIASAWPDLQRTLNQLKQLEVQIRSEQEILLQ